MRCAAQNRRPSSAETLVLSSESQQAQAQAQAQVRVRVRVLRFLLMRAPDSRVAEQARPQEPGRTSNQSGELSSIRFISV